MQQLWEPMGLDSRQYEAIALSGLAAVVFALIATGAVIATLSHKTKRNTEYMPRRSDIKTLVLVGLGGLVALGAGYLPIIIAVFPGLGYPTTRANHLPAIGASVFVCSIVFLTARMLNRDRDQAQHVALVAVLPLLWLAITQQVTIQNQIARAWDEQKQVWTQIFVQAPDFADGTNILLLLTGENAQTQSPFISGSGSMTSALRLLYGTDNIQGDFAYGSPEQVLSVENGDLVVSAYGRRTQPVAETAVFVYDRGSTRLAQLTALQVSGQTVSLGSGRILTVPSQAANYRRLVE